METGAFVTEGSPAVKIDFRTASDTSGGEISGEVVQVQTDRGTIWEQMQTETEDAISKYGKLFVALLVVLSVGFLISTVYKKRKAKRRMAREAELAEENQENGLDVIMEQYTETEREDSLPMKEVRSYDDEEQSRAGEAEAKSVASGWGGWFGGMFDKKETPQSVVEPPEPSVTQEQASTVIEEVEVELRKSYSSDDVEVSLSNKKGWFSK
jgi:hypothetical protein